MILHDFRVFFLHVCLEACESHATVAPPSGCHLRGHRRIRQVSEKRAAADDFF